MKRESCFGCWLSSSLRPRLGANERTPLSPPFEGLVVVLALIWVAWLVSRAAGRVATFIVLRGERKHAPGIEDTGVIASLKQRRRRSRSRGRVRFFAFTLAALLSLSVLLGARPRGDGRGRLLRGHPARLRGAALPSDVIAGLLMFHERWFQIGDTVELEPLSIAGVVEDATLRTVTMRNVAGEVIRVSNSEVKAIRVLPRGYRQVEAELFVTDADAGCELVRQVGGLVPTGPDTLHPPADRRRDRPARGRPAPDP